MELQPSHRIVYRNLNKSGPWIYQNGKIMFHMSLPHGEVCDLIAMASALKDRRNVFYKEKSEKSDTPLGLKGGNRSKTLCRTGEVRHGIRPMKGKGI